MTAQQAHANLKEVSTGTKSRLFIGFILAAIFSFLVNNIITFWFGGPGVLNLFAHFGLFDLSPDNDSYTSIQLLVAAAQLALYFVAIVVVIRRVRAHPGMVGLINDAKRYANFVSFLIRAAFWSVILVGIADAVISFLRVEDFLRFFVSEQLTKDLGVPQFRGFYLHFPLIIFSCVIAFFTRSLSFIWLAVLVVFSEFSIVITRFVFSYEQAFMGDLVRFWYGGLFLFASAYALVTEGHVRVDVIYSLFGKRKKAWSNAIGSVVLGIPICVTILVLGMWGRGSSLNAPLLSYEISQSGFGMYVKYLMAGFLIVFALSMLVQFAAYFLENVAILLSDDDSSEAIEIDTSSATQAN